ncbi:MAG: toll/interleukin-1 receptor domain-containing protein [Candidatus Thiodiazotropha weberae]|nr:toll/interleukin-1 receptor domain-containing protein [Candidatus Thiodiazotropha weberae]
MIEFEIGGRRINPDNIGDAIMAAVLEGIRDEIRKKVGTIRDPETGAFPTVVVRGNSLDDLSMSVEGSPEIVALVKESLGISEGEDDQNEEETQKPPKAFLSYTSDDRELAQRIAESLQANGIETWWDKWCISAGDSLRQKIDEGLAGCTHFLVLLTPQSIRKPWVNQEMDAGLVRKLNNKCRFLPVRYKLPASDLPPLLSGMLAPEIISDEDITQLINDIHDVTRKPPLGPSPQTVTQSTGTQTGYSSAANAIAKLFVERSKNGVFSDPDIEVEELAEKTGLTIPDVKDALYELSHHFEDSPFHILVQPSLFTEFDEYWQPWNPADDALKLAIDIASDKDFPSNCQKIAERYSWEPRRLNPAVTYLYERGLLIDSKVLGMPQFVMVRALGKEDEIRRFLKSQY